MPRIDAHALYLGLEGKNYVVGGAGSAFAGERGGCVSKQLSKEAISVPTF